MINLNPNDISLDHLLIVIISIIIPMAVRETSFVVLGFSLGFLTVTGFISHMMINHPDNETLKKFLDFF